MDQQTTLNITIDKKTKALLKDFCEQNGITMAYAVRSVITDLLEKRGIDIQSSHRARKLVAEAAALEENRVL